MNIRVYCEVTFIGNPTFINWFLIRVVGQIVLRFNINCTGTRADSQDFGVTGEIFGVGTTQSKIVNILLTFNNLQAIALLECAEGKTMMAIVTLRIICEFRKGSGLCTIIWEIKTILVNYVGTTTFSK